ncbi:MAG: FKBP-type peptidyl-prolyl cis-trans isomerase [bacterium]
MKKIVISTLILTFIVFSACEDMKKASQDSGHKSVTKKDLEEDASKESYAMGLDMASNFKQRGFEVKPEFFIAGFKTAWEDGEALLDDEEKKAAMMNMQTRMMQKMQQEMSQKAAGNKEEGKKFLEENKKKDGVKETESGLQYKVEKKGKGPKPSAEDTVEVHYRGTFIDGTEFDSSHSRGEPVTFPLNKVIPGWTEGLQLMSEGAKYKFFVPSDLAYGDRGNQKVDPGKTLIFDVELLDIKKEK